MKVTFGRYLPLNSIIHKVDPRIKLVVLISLIVSVFFNTGFTGYLVIGAVIFSLFTLSKLSFVLLWRLLIPMFFITAIIFLIGIVFTNRDIDITNTTIIMEKGFLKHWDWKFIKIRITKEVIFQSIYTGVRIYWMILITTILTTTTQPLDLTLALEDLMKPLKVIRFPVHIISMIISISLRSIPTLFDEAGKILKAQASRGVDLRNGHFNEKIKALVSLIIPLLISSFQKAEDLAYAMDSRGYDPVGKRTRFRQYHIRFKDILFLLIGMGIFAGIITLYFNGYCLLPFDKFVMLKK